MALTQELEALVTGALKDIYSQREEIIRAFLAKYHCQPDEIEQVEERTANGWRWHVRWKPRQHEGA